MWRVHLEDMKHRSDGELLFTRNKRRMDIVDELGGVGHCYFIRVTIKDVESNSRDQCISQGREICPEIARIDRWIGMVPGAPFIDDQLDPVFTARLAPTPPVVLYSLLQSL